jgi:virulence-associated protein VapD
MATGQKQVAFDLDTDALKKYYPTNSWNYAYDVIKRHMQRNGFLWLQGSVYVSEKPMSGGRVTRVIRRLVDNNPWINVCMRDCRQSNIGKEHSQNYLFDKSADIPPRE